MDKDMHGISQRIEAQLSKFEDGAEEADVRIERVKKYLHMRIAHVRRLVFIMKRSEDPMVLSHIVDILGDIERVSEKLTSIDITPSGYKETSLESITDGEYDEIAALLS